MTEECMVNTADNNNLVVNRPCMLLIQALTLELMLTENNALIKIVPKKNVVFWVPLTLWSART